MMQSSVSSRILLVLCGLWQLQLGHSSPWMNTNLSPRDRAQLILKEMTIDEKLVMLHGTSGSQYVGYVAGNERLGIPALKLNDGPQGFRDDNYPGTTTSFPSGLTVAATWDTELCYQYGKAMGEEFFQKGTNVQLGPGMNLARVPLNGRNFEYMSGGDPYLGYALVQPVIQGIQSTGVIANAKHWVENNQETDRDTVSANVDERTRHELYYQPFQGAVEAKVGSFMCSYNKINDLWSCENPETLNTDLKGHLGFEGWVMSDWGATHSLSINAGLDQEMPGSDYFSAEQLKSGLDNNTIDAATVDASVLRMLIPMFEVGLFDTENNNLLSANVTSPEHTRIARELSAASQVLLKNDDNILPLTQNGPTRIAVFGKAAVSPIVSGGGSGAVFASYIQTPYHALLNELKISIDDTPATVCDTSKVIENWKIAQWGCQSAPAKTLEECANQCASYGLCAYYTFTGSRCNFYPTGNHKQPANGSTTGSCVKGVPSSEWKCNSAGVCVAYADGSDLEGAVKLAKESDIALVAIGTFAKEGSDRATLSFAANKDGNCQVIPPNQDELVQAIAENGFARSSSGYKTVVAMTAPGAVLTPWRDDVQAVILGFLPGQEYGAALMDVLFGRFNPTARLPMTLPNIDNEIKFTKAQYPGIRKEGNYSEKMLIDYRWYVENNVKPAFSFGHGLSYTSFEYSNLLVSSTEASVTVKNAGMRPGQDIPQLYLTYPSNAGTPAMQLRGFEKTVLLAPGESTRITFPIRARDRSVWNVTSHSWKEVSGEFIVSVGASLSDLRLKGSFEI